MSPERWARVKELFDGALDREPGGRTVWLDQVCPAGGADGDLRREVDSLLAAHAEAGEFLEVPVLAASAASLAPDLSPGTRMGPYEIVRAIAAGGMGEVFRARDTRLRRDVAIKVLPALAAIDADRVRRFEKEARAASALNHPNIVSVFDAGRHEGLPFIVTELLEGETLAERVGRGPLGVRPALECAQQIASGLVAAHERGIVHRDLKPANLFMTTQGQVKILDFGVAKLSLSIDDVSEARTTPGLVVGTAGYMSPEQVNAQPVDERSDQFSLGCVLYELLTGRQPFQRASAAQTNRAVVRVDPEPLGDGEPPVPREVALLVDRCLAKKPRDRYPSTRELARDLELALGRLSLPGAGPTPAAHAVPALAFLTHSGRDSSPAASRDGRAIAFSSRRDRRRRIWLKQLATGNEAPLTDGDADDLPRFAPDGSSVLFARSEAGQVSLWRVALVGGEQRKVVDDALCGDFSPDGRLIGFVRRAAEGSGSTSIVFTAASDGSEARELARLDDGDHPAGAFGCLRWSPDGRRLALTRSTRRPGEPAVVALVDAASRRVCVLEPPGIAGDWRGGLAWTGPDQVVCAGPRVLLWDLASGGARPLLSSPTDIVAIDLVAPGRMVLETRAVHQRLHELPLGEDAGSGGGRWLTRGNAIDRQPIVSPDGDRVAFSSNRSGNLDIWAVSRATGAITRLTDGAAQDSDPAFMPDGRLLWSSNRSGTFEVWLAAADGSGARQVTCDGVLASNPVAAPDGTWIYFASANPKTRGIVKIRPDGTGAALLVAGNAILPEVSPDGAHLACVADEGTEKAAVRVVRLSDGQEVFEIPQAGRSRWLPDGRGLVYLEREDGNCAVYLQPFAPGAPPAGPPRRVAWLAPDLDAESLAVTPDGAALVVSVREERADLMLADAT